MPKPKELPSQAYLMECLSYDPATGTLTWKTRPVCHFPAAIYWKTWNTKWANKRAGATQTDKFGRPRRSVGLGGIRWLAARIIWKMMTGTDPPAEVDHISRDATDDRWVNLRLAIHRENTRNSSKKMRPLPKGVYVTRYGNRWFSQITVNYKTIYLGTFDSPEAAHGAYCEAARRLHGEYADFGKRH